MPSPTVDVTSFLDVSILEAGREVCIADKSISFTPKPYPLIHYVYAGMGSFQYEGKSYQLKAGDCFLIPAGETASYRAYPEQPWSYYWIGIGGAKGSALLAYAGFGQGRPVLHDKALAWKRFFEGIYESYYQKGAFDLKSLSNVYGLLAAMSASTKTGGVKESERGHILAAKSYIRNNFQFPITMTDVARSVGVSPNYLANLFQREGEPSPKAFLTNTRMEAASTMLLSSSSSVAEIAHAVGYLSPLHFSKAFKLHFGCSPLHYRSKGGNS